ncbi:hypothetical protein CTI12_AA421070 [Artemisia annua]|uniref:Stomagen C-terminal domain-containing protein n=1 Tax=Artemisia annua TaxID=35608 RepID=A0A2U1M3Y9_ARTAN|nr:hypothetical protein CTI12_AA421070 [Artemisia annua]
MASPSKHNLLILFLIWAALVLQGVAGSRTLAQLPAQNPATQKELHLKHTSNIMMRRRKMIGSVRPSCTYNECKGCKSRCRAEQVPVEGNDPMNSAYHYRCVCHRHNLYPVQIGRPSLNPCRFDPKSCLACTLWHQLILKDPKCVRHDKKRMIKYRMMIPFMYDIIQNDDPLYKASDNCTYK